LKGDDIMWVSVRGKHEPVFYDPDSFRFVDDQHAQVKVAWVIGSHDLVEAVICIEIGDAPVVIDSTNWYKATIKVNDVLSVKVYDCNELTDLPIWFIEKVVERVKTIFERE